MYIKNSIIAACVTLASYSASISLAIAADPHYPDKPIRMLASGIGGAGDFTARLISSGLAPHLGQQIIVDNRPGGLVPGEIVAKAQPDGYTLMLAGVVIWLSPFTRDKMPFDPVRDFAPITLAVNLPNVLVVNLSVPVKSVSELIALAKQKPGALNYATSGMGNSNHIAGELFKAMAGVNLVQINYKGATLAMNDVISGRVQVMFATATAAAPQVASGRVRALAVSSAQPSSLAPGLPTIAASGVPGYESGSTLGVFAPAATPPAIINFLNKEIVTYLKTREAKERLFNAGIDVIASTPAQFAAAIKTDMAQTGKVLHDAGIRTDD